MPGRAIAMRGNLNLEIPAVDEVHTLFEKENPLLKISFWGIIIWRLQVSYTIVGGQGAGSMFCYFSHIVTSVI
jgi:hypothetical protein